MCSSWKTCLVFSDSHRQQLLTKTGCRTVSFSERRLMPRVASDDDELLTRHTSHCEEDIKMDELDTMFSHLLEEIDDLTKGLAESADTISNPESCMGRSNLDESGNGSDSPELDIFVVDQSAQPREDVPTRSTPMPPSSSASASPADHVTQALDSEPGGPPQLTELQTLQTMDQPPFMILKVLMADGGSKTLKVEGPQTVRDVLDKLFEKTHCDRGADWSLCETNPELSVERILEDHECLVESLSAISGAENKIYFLRKPWKHILFEHPQFFYLWKTSFLKTVSEQEKQLLLKENFEGLSVAVPDLEGWLYLKDDGRKMWKPRYFVLRASGLYYVPRGKTRSSSDLACFVRFEQVNVYQADGFRLKYRAPTDHCFVLKHPCIQKESHYVKFLCCDDEDSVLLWFHSIRVAKYGAVLYENYKSAVTRAERPSSLSRNNTDTSSRVNVAVPDQDQDEGPPDFIPPPPPGLTAVL